MQDNKISCSLEKNQVLLFFCNYGATITESEISLKEVDDRAQFNAGIHENGSILLAFGGNTGFAFHKIFFSRNRRMFCQYVSSGLTVSC